MASAGLSMVRFRGIHAGTYDGGGEGVGADRRSRPARLLGAANGSGDGCRTDRADRSWLARLVTRRERPENFAKALARTADDIKVVVQFADA